MAQLAFALGAALSACRTRSPEEIERMSSHVEFTIPMTGEYAPEGAPNVNEANFRELQDRAHSLIFTSEILDRRTPAGPLVYEAIQSGNRQIGVASEEAQHVPNMSVPLALHEQSLSEMSLEQLIKEPLEIEVSDGKLTTFPDMSLRQMLVGSIQANLSEMIRVRLHVIPHRSEQGESVETTGEGPTLRAALVSALLSFGLYGGNHPVGTKQDVIHIFSSGHYEQLGLDIHANGGGFMNMHIDATQTLPDGSVRVHLIGSRAESSP